MATAIDGRRGAQAFLDGGPKQLLIGGAWVPAASGRTFATLNPATEAKIAQVAEGDAADVDAAVRAARSAFELGPWSRMSGAERGKLLYRLAELIDAGCHRPAGREAALTLRTGGSRPDYVRFSGTRPTLRPGAGGPWPR